MELLPTDLFYSFIIFDKSNNIFTKETCNRKEINNGRSLKKRYYLFMKTIVLFDQNDSTFFRNDICIILRGLTIPKKHTININNYMGISFQKELKRIAFKQGD